MNWVFKDGRQISEYERDLNHYFFLKSSLKRAKEHFLRGNPSHLENLDAIKIIPKIGKKITGCILGVVPGHCLNSSLILLQMYFCFDLL